MDLSGIYINSTEAARVCAAVLMRNAARSSGKDADLGGGGGRGAYIARIIRSSGQSEQIGWHDSLGDQQMDGGFKCIVSIKLTGLQHKKLTLRTERMGMCH